MRTQNEDIVFGSGQRLDVGGDAHFTQTLSESTLTFTCGNRDQVKLLTAKPSLRLHYRDHEYRVIRVRENHVTLQGIHPTISQANTGVVLRSCDLEKTTDLADEARPVAIYEGTADVDGFTLRTGDRIDISEGETLVKVRVVSVGYDLVAPQKITVVLKGERSA